MEATSIPHKLIGVAGFLAACPRNARTLEGLGVGLDLERQPGVRRPQGALDLRRAVRAREDEAEGRRSLRQRHERPADGGADRDVVDAWDAGRAGDPRDAAQDARAW